MAVEARRGCGFRKIGGLYLVSEPGGRECDRLPIPLTVCPTCSHGFKQARGFTWVDVFAFVAGNHLDCKDVDFCPLCHATRDMGRAGLLWIGERFYKTPAEFNKESLTLGVSRRIHALPREFKVGSTWILLAHPKAIVEKCRDCDGAGLLVNGETKVCGKCEGTGESTTAAIFKVWRPQRLEKILPESKRGSREVEDLKDRGITPVFVPDDDPDHRGSVYDKAEEE